MQKNNLYALMQKTKNGQHMVAEVVAPNKKTAAQLFDKTLQYTKAKDGIFFIGQLYYPPYQIGKARTDVATRYELKPRQVKLVKPIDKDPFPWGYTYYGERDNGPWFSYNPDPNPPKSPYLERTGPSKPASKILPPKENPRPTRPTLPNRVVPVLSKPTIRSKPVPKRTYPNRQGSPVKPTIIRKK